MAYVPTERMPTVKRETKECGERKRHYWKSVPFRMWHTENDECRRDLTLFDAMIRSNTLASTFEGETRLVRNILQCPGEQVVIPVGASSVGASEWASTHSWGTMRH